MTTLPLRRLGISIRAKSPHVTMDRKSERLAKKIEKAGIRASIKEGHQLTEAELRDIKVQVLPSPLRIIFGVLGVIAGLLSFSSFAQDADGQGFLWASVSLFMLLFGIFGVRKTLSRILDSMDAVDAAEILGHAIEGIASAVESLFDGV
jgi:sulfite exporter TauE/SafE